MHPTGHVGDTCRFVSDTLTDSTARRPSPRRGRVKRSTQALAVAALAALPCNVAAQRPHGLRFSYPQPDCRLARMAYDNPLSDHWGWRMRRWEWHTGYAVASVGISEALSRTTRMSPMTAAIATTALIGLGPHLRGGLFQQKYAINPRDWIADILVRSAPIWIAAMRRERSTSDRVATAAGFFTAYAAVACWSSP
jgi:hypothetical protein